MDPVNIHDINKDCLKCLLDIVVEMCTSGCLCGSGALGGDPG